MKQDNTEKKDAFRMRYILTVWFLSMLGIYGLSACGEAEVPPGQAELQLYYLKTDDSGIESKTSYFDSDLSADELIGQILEALSTAPEDVNLKNPINSTFTCQEYVLDQGQLTLNFSAGYDELDSLKEVLIRAAIAGTMLELKEVDNVTFFVDGESVTDSRGRVIGRMDASTFIHTTGAQNTIYEKMILNIYFADETGSILLPVERTVLYSSNLSTEKLVVKQIIAGPANEDSYCTINPSTTVKSVLVQDGICYVNLSKEFLVQVEGVTSQTALYSIVNSLTELNGINKVKISVEDEAEGVYFGEISLDTIFERDLDRIAH